MGFFVSRHLGPVVCNIGYMKRFLPLLIILPLLIWIACEDSDSEVTLWGEVYSVENTTYLRLDYNQLTGSIPPEIGNMTNLEWLYLGDNQLTGSIPESICNLNLDWNYSSISNNQFCPPYPSCIEDSIGEQDTTNCN